MVEDPLLFLALIMKVYERPATRFETLTTVVLISLIGTGSINSDDPFV